MLTVDECWDFLESHSREHGTGNPSQLPSRAESKALDDAAAVIGARFPEDLRRFLARHDGSGDYYLAPYKFGGGEQVFMPVADIVSYWKEMVAIGRDFENGGEFGSQVGPVRQHVWSAAWVPFAQNSCGDLLFVDLDPADGGRIGQVVDWWHEGAQSTFRAFSVHEWLNELIDDLRNNVCQFTNART